MYVQRNFSKAISSTPLQVLIAYQSIDTARGKVNKDLLGCLDALDWDNAIKFLNFHKMSQMLYWQIRQHNAGVLIPDNVLSELKGIYKESVERQKLFSEETKTISSMFQNKGIDSLVYKGASLSGYFPEHGLRRYGDIDIIIRRDSFLQADRIIQNMGYVRASSLPSSSQLQVLLKYGYCANYTKELDCGIKIPLELHWELGLKRLQLPGFLESAWNSSVKYDIGGVAVNVMCPAHLWISLCHHGAKHVWYNIRWLADLVAVSNIMQESDYAIADDIACRLKIKRSKDLAECLLNEAGFSYLIYKKTQMTSPENVIRRLVKIVVQRFNNGCLDSPSLALGRHFEVSVLDSFLARIKYYISWLYIPSVADIQSVRLPKSLQFFYVFVRFGRLVLLKPFRAMKIFRSVWSGKGDT